MCRKYLSPGLPKIQIQKFGPLPEISTPSILRECSINNILLSMRNKTCLIFQKVGYIREKREGEKDESMVGGRSEERCKGGGCMWSTLGGRLGNRTYFVKVGTVRRYLIHSPLSFTLSPPPPPPPSPLCSFLLCVYICLSNKVFLITNILNSPSPIFIPFLSQTRSPFFDLIIFISFPEIASGFLGSKYLGMYCTVGRE